MQAPSHPFHTVGVEASLLTSWLKSTAGGVFTRWHHLLQVINKRKNEKPEARKATREAALREARPLIC